MAKQIRVVSKIFGQDGAAGQFGKIGSAAAGSPVTTKDLTVIQSLQQYLDGLYSITADSGEPPRIEDINALYFLVTSQIAYLMQNGIPEWLNDASQRYYIDVSFVSRSGSIYQAIKGDDASNINTQQDPATKPEYWRLVYALPVVIPWDSLEASAYDVAGIVVDRYGMNFTSSGKASNTNKDPILPGNFDFWIKSPGKDLLVQYALEGKVLFGGMHPSTDFNDADYQNTLKIDSRDFGGTTYNFYRVELDGDVVTGDATLEAILDPGGADEYPYIDLLAPDNLGTRTLVDVKGRVLRGIDSTGGQADTLAEILEDQFQGFEISGSVTSVGVAAGGLGAAATTYSTASQTFDNHIGNQALASDGVNGTPRIGSNTRDKSITVGVPYIIVMIAA